MEGGAGSSLLSSLLNVEESVGQETFFSGDFGQSSVASQHAAYVLDSVCADWDLSFPCNGIPSKSKV